MAAEEQRVSMEFIEKHPYPDYNTICNRLLKDKKLDWYSEYSIDNHNRCKAIYEQPFNRDVARLIGQQINAIGGFTAMQANFYILAKYSPWATSNKMVIRSIPKIIEYHWDGIGEWIS